LAFSQQEADCTTVTPTSQPAHPYNVVIHWLSVVDIASVVNKMPTVGLGVISKNTSEKYF